MRSELEIQRAHDMLTAVKLGEVPCVASKKDMELMSAAIDVLCWVLQHDHNRNFEGNLKTIEEKLSDMGYTLGRHNN